MKKSDSAPSPKFRASGFVALLSRIRFLLFLAAAIALAGNARAQFSTVAVDFGGTDPTPGPDDIAQLLTDSGSPDKPDTLNYYFDNGTPPGQTFTTGSNPNGYVLNSLYIRTAGLGNLPAAGQSLIVRLYSVSGTTATFLYSFTCQPTFTFSETDWLQFTNLTPIGLRPNTQYAYSLRRVTTGWEDMASVGNNAYASGELCLIPTGGGTMTLGASHSFDATFDVNLTQANSLTVNPPIITPSSSVAVGTAVTITTPPAVGPGPIFYQWQTDGGTGGALTNIPFATNATLSVNTTGMLFGTYQYAVVATNSTSSVSSTNVLTVFQVANSTFTDVGLNFGPGQYDVNQLSQNNPQVSDGLNYYSDNANPPGQTFTTGTNSQGYYLSSITVGTGGGTANSTTTLQGYNVRLYSVNGSNATLLVSFTNASFSYVYGDWVTCSFAPFVLKSNSTFAYTFHRNTTGWAGLATDAGTSDLYPGGQICLIPPGGGTITFGASGLVDAAFDLGLIPIGTAPTVPFANPISVSPSAIALAGTQLTLTEAPSGATPFSFQWQTDGGKGGALTNIPSSNSSNLVLNTTGWAPGPYQFDVIVTNSFGSSTSVVTTVTLTYADGSGLLTDIGSGTPAPLTDDISQLIGGGPRKPDNLNYYTDNASPPAQTFTTGANPNGYTLTSLALHTAGDSGQLPALGQAYQLRLYTVQSGTNAVLYATYTSRSNFTFVDSDWLRWSGLNVPLASNTVYAYSFGRVSSGSGWENMDNIGGDVYAGGQLALISPLGGPITFGSSASYDAVFVAGLAVASYPNVEPTLFSPADTVYAGTPVTVSAAVTGTGPFTYQWQTDGGTGTFTNIPAATNPTLSVDTTALGGQVSYRLVASNGSGSTTGEFATLTVNGASAPLVLTPYSLPETNLVIIGGTTVLRVNQAGTLPITNQWTLNGVNLSDNGRITGSQSNILTITNVQPSDAGYYQLNLTNSVGGYTLYPAGGADQNLLVVAVPTFYTNGLGWLANGSATIDANLLTMVNGGGQVGSFFLNSTVYIGAFEASFIYQDVGGGGADGFTFCLQNDPRGPAASGGGGSDLGVSSIKPAAEVTFNIYANNTPGISFGTNGANGAPFTPTTPVDISSGDAILVKLVYGNGVLNVTLTDTNTSATYSTSISANLPAIVGGQQAYVGFTGASGGSASTQTITDFTYVPLTAMTSHPAGTNVVLNWPTIPGGYVLQSSPSLTSPNWQNDSAPITQVGGQNQATVPGGPGMRFYRLAIPVPAQ